MTKLARKRIIMDRTGKQEYLVRYHLLFREKANTFDRNVDVPFNLFLHKILLSDEPIFHDHPWNFFTIILKGGYYEHTPEGKFWRGPGYIGFRRAKDLHYLELKDNKPCVTLFGHGARKRAWGFIDPVTNKWMHYRDYLLTRNKS